MPLDNRFWTVVGESTYRFVSLNCLAALSAAALLLFFAGLFSICARIVYEYFISEY